MRGENVLKYLKYACRVIDSGCLPIAFPIYKRLVIVPASLCLALGAVGCGAPSRHEQPEELLCQDGLDNDGDGHADCEDSDCHEDDYCRAIPPYMAPPEADCADGLDNDYDLLVDCDDSDCAEAPACSVDLYGCPFV